MSGKKKPTHHTMKHFLPSSLAPRTWRGTQGASQLSPPKPNDQNQLRDRAQGRALSDQVLEVINASPTKVGRAANIRTKKLTGTPKTWPTR
eukprot:m.445226 g.445226  ORF g.445226 m.445226 type:complete len:91 (+) comp56847_c0_seq12:286-558(+)